MASHHTRAFDYESIRDQQEAIEMWRDLALGAGVIILAVFCPPAAAVVGFTLAAADMYSAISGKDWGTGRELDPTERGLRGFFALIDLVPGGISLIKGGKGTGKLVGKQLLKEGAEQGAHTIDDGLKVLAKFGDNVLKQVDNFGRQGDQLLNKLIASSADQLSAGLKTIDGTISQAAQNFRLNMGLEPQLVSGAMPSPGSSSINKITNKLDDFSKARKLRISNLDEVGDTTRVERLKNFAAGNCSFDDVLPDFVDEYVEAVNSNKPWSWENNIFNGGQISKGQRAKIKNAAFESGLLPKINVTPVEGMRFGFADFRGAGLVEVSVELPKDMWLKSDIDQFKWLDEQIGGSRPGMTWHHTEIPGKMELVPTGIHNIITHNGGRSPGMWAYAPR